MKKRKEHYMYNYISNPSLAYLLCERKMSLVFRQITVLTFIIIGFSLCNRNSFFSPRSELELGQQQPERKRNWFPGSSAVCSGQTWRMWSHTYIIIKVRVRWQGKPDSKNSATPTVRLTPRQNCFQSGTRTRRVEISGIVREGGEERREGSWPNLCP